MPSLCVLLALNLMGTFEGSEPGGEADVTIIEQLLCEHLRLNG